MSRIDKLIDNLCPDGVELKELGELGEFENIGVDKKILIDQSPVLLLNYMDVYRNKYITKNIISMKVTASEAKIENCSIRKGDIFLTPTSETIEDIGHSAVAVEDVIGTVYSYHIMRYRQLNINLTTSYYINYLFETETVKKQILKLASGLTRFGLSKSKFAKIQIPIPPIPIQQEIVNILDKFTALDAELQAELEARKKQYEYYRNQLLDFEGKEVEWKMLGEVCEKIDNIRWKDNINKEFKYIDLTSVSRENNSISDTQIIDSTNAPSRAQQIVFKNDVIFGTTRPTLKRFSLITSHYHNQICSTGFCVLRANQDTILPKFLFFIIKTSSFNKHVEKYQEGASYPSISDNRIKQFKIPIPPLAEQERIVSILDKFEELVNSGLPAEIEARRKQYEYYREKLLTFNKVEQIA